jgi:hypothetical protein
LHQRNIGKAIAGPPTGQSDISGAIDHLAREVARLSLRMKLMESIEHATEVMRAAESLRIAASYPANDCQPQLRDALARCDERLVVRPKDSITPVLVNENTGIAGTGPAETKAADPEFSVGNGESAIAARILNLHERLGSFIKP